MAAGTSGASGASFLDGESERVCSGRLLFAAKACWFWDSFVFMGEVELVLSPSAVVVAVVGSSILLSSGFA